MSTDEQADAYLREANLTLRAAEAIHESATESGEQLWAQVVKNGYDAIEQAVSAGIAAAGEAIPRSHPAKINTFLELYAVPSALETSLLEWLRRRGASQYVDIRGDQVNVPHRNFEREDADRILEDAQETLTFVEDVVAP